MSETRTNQTVFGVPKGALAGGWGGAKAGTREGGLGKCDAG